VTSLIGFVLYRCAYLIDHQAPADSRFAIGRLNMTGQFAYQRYWSMGDNQTIDKKSPNPRRRHAKSPHPLSSALAKAQPIAIAGHLTYRYGHPHLPAATPRVDNRYRA